MRTKRTDTARPAVRTALLPFSLLGHQRSTENQVRVTRSFPATPSVFPSLTHIFKNSSKRMVWGDICVKIYSILYPHVDLMVRIHKKQMNKDNCKHNNFLFIFMEMMIILQKRFHTSSLRSVSKMLLNPLYI